MDGVEGSTMMEKRQLIPILGLIATIVIAMFMVANAAAQSPSMTGDSSNDAATWLWQD